jgi:phage I-like protein
MNPKKFRIFRKGLNPSSKGTFLFDEAAAKAVMDHYAQEGVEIMIDLEHRSLNDDSKNYDPDARGWCKLEVINGELWATNVRWTLDGESRLSEQRQRYISPAFTVDKESGRVQAVLNLALVAMPATHGAQDLLAAARFAALTAKFPSSNVQTTTLSMGSEENRMPPELLTMLGLSAEASADDVMNALKAVLAKVPPPPAPGTPDPAAELARLSARVLGLEERAKAGDKAVAELKAIKDKEEADKRTALLSKVPKNLEAWASKQPIPVIEEYLAAAGASEPAREPATPAGSTVELSKDELEVCKATGTDPKKFLDFKLAKQG